MSHFSVLVFTDGNKTVDELLEPYYEGLMFPHYTTKQQLIEKERERFKDYKNSTYAEYIKDPESYKKKYLHARPEHFDYLENEFPKRFSWGDEEFYTEAIRYVEQEDIRPDGSVFSTYNPNAKWDYHVRGGEWSKLPLKDGSITYEAGAQDIDFQKIDVTYAVVTPNGEWHAPGEVGWWGMSSESEDEMKEWKEYRFPNLIKKAIENNWQATIEDCHI